MLKELIKLANHLDRRGLVSESDKLDGIIRSMAKSAIPDSGASRWGTFMYLKHPSWTLASANERATRDMVKSVVSRTYEAMMRRRRAAGEDPKEAGSDLERDMKTFHNYAMGHRVEERDLQDLFRNFSASDIQTVQIVPALEGAGNPEDAQETFNELYHWLTSSEMIKL